MNLLGAVLVLAITSDSRRMLLKPVMEWNCSELAFAANVTPNILHWLPCDSPAATQQGSDFRVSRVWLGV